jgi:hypothetical protein
MNRKDIYIQSFNGAVIRDVLIFNQPNRSVPDETDATVWEITAQVYFDTASENETGMLTIRRDDELGQNASVPVRLSSTQTSKSVKLLIPVRIYSSICKYNTSFRS